MKRIYLATMLAAMLFLLSGCFIQPDPTLDPLVIHEGVVPFGTVQPLPTNTPTPVAENQPTPTPDAWQSSDQSTWEDWAQGSLPTSTPRTAATAAPGAQSWATSTEDYNAGYPVLMMGSTGTDVSDLQARLTELGYYTGAIDGRYASGTQTAVQEFQERNGLTADGIAGRQTQDLLYSGSAQPKYVTVSASGDAEEYLLLKQGTSGVEVRKLQGRLAELGYYAGGVDGIYGETTASAVKAFQRANGLSGDGQAGVQTQSKLYSSSARYASSPVATANPDATRTLTLGMTGNDVYALQERLIELRYLSGVADGVFGAETQAALIAFQKNNGLTEDGNAGSSTLKKLAGSCKAATRTTPTPVPSGTVTLREGDEGENVYILQAYLFELGYYTGRIDGRFSAETTEAVKAFQRANGLTADGIAGKGTLSILYSGSAVAYGGSSGGSSSSGSVPSATATPKPNTDIVIQWESEGDDVRQYQQRLVELGYLSSKYVTGKFNQPTVEATKAFQTMNGLKVDGAAGPQSLKLIYSNDALNADGVRVGDLLMSSSGTGVSEVLTAGMTGEQVRQVQSRLAELGYLSASFVNGVYDDNTRQAIRRFQQANGLTADGAAGSATQSRLYASGAVTAQTARMAGDNTGRQTQEYRVNGAYQLSVGGGGIAVGDRSALYCADASQGGALVKRPYDGSAATVLAYETPRFLHLTNGRLYYVASSGGEDCVIRMNADGTSHEVLDRAGVILRFALHDGVMYVLDANGALKERTLSGEESELMEGVADFCLDVQGNALLCVTQKGVVSFGIDTGRTTTLYAGSADQAVLCADILLVRSGGSILRVANGQTATIRRDGAKLMGVYGQKVISLTGKGVMTCDVNGENATMILYGAYETMSAANGVLYVGDGKGVAQQVTL